MITGSRLRTEVLRIFRSPVTLLVMLLVVLCPVAGYFLYRPVMTSTTAGTVLANPALAGGLGGAFLFAMLTLYELHRAQKNAMDPLTDSMISPFLMHVFRMAALLAAALVTALVTLLVYLPYTVYRLGEVFFIEEYLNSFGLFMFSVFPMGIFAAAAFYQIFRRVDLSFVCFTALALFSMSRWCKDEYLLRWINPLVTGFSSDFGNTVIYRFTAYSRLLWILVFVGVWLLSLLFVRVYGKGASGSVFQNLRRIYLPASAGILFGISILLFVRQPYVDHTPLQTDQAVTSSGEFSTYVSGGQEQEEPAWKVLSSKIWLKPDVDAGTAAGRAVYQIDNQSGLEQDCVMNVNPGCTVEQILANGQEISFLDPDIDYEYSMKDISFSLPADGTIELEISYSVAPQIPSMAKRLMMPGNEITPRFISLRGNAVQPKFSIPANCPVEGEITLPEDMELISLGTLPEVIRINRDGTKTWRVSSASGALILYAGDYVRIQVKDASFPVYFYYSSVHRKQMEALNIEEIITETIAYCSKHYGVLPFTEEEPLQIVMDSAHFMGGGATGNISNMTESAFTEESMADPLKGAEAAEIIAHEIVHQWWGIRRFVMDPEYQTWTAEALTTYTTYRMMKEKYGKEYGETYYIDVWNAATQDMNQNFFLRNPGYQALLPEKYLAELMYSVQGRNTYSKAPLQILKAEQLIGGEAAMDSVLSKLFISGGTEMPPFITWQDFLDACNLSEEQLTLDKDTAGTQEVENHD